jgi:cytochrome c5
MKYLISLLSNTKFRQKLKAVCQSLGLGGLLFLSMNANTLASDLVKQYYAELLRYESVQITEKAVFNYVHPAYGNDLRKLLDINRAPLVIDAFVNAKMKESEKAEVPNLTNQFGSIHRRIERAFNLDPINYEAEYLDSLAWTVELIVRSNTASKEQFNKPMPSTPGMDAQQMRQLIESMQGVQEVAIKWAAQSIQQQINEEKFTASGAIKARELVIRLRMSAHASIGADQAAKKFRAVANGKQVYESQCIACHAGGVAASPRLGDRAAWRPRLNQGLEKLIASALRGKGAMGSQGGGDWQDFEIARAVVYMANSAGASFSEPPIPKNHSGLVEVKNIPLPSPPPPAVPYSQMNAAEKLIHGEKVYFANCVACHGVRGQGAVSEIPPLAPSAQSMSSDALIRVLLNGQNGGRMPAWRQLPNTEIASVVNYTRIKFGGKSDSAVQPDQVETFRALRN